MGHFLAPFHLSLVVIGRTFVLIASEEMACGGASKAFFHVVGADVLSSYLNITHLISCIVAFVVKLLHMLKL